MILNDSIVLGLQAISSNAGKLCYQNIVNFGNISTDTEIDGYPATNLANPSTAFGWRGRKYGTSSFHTIEVDNPDRSAVDYIGIARHNLGSNGAEVRVRFDDVTVYDWAPAPTQQSVLYLFEEATPSNIKIDITRGGDDDARVAVLYVGKSITLQRNIYVGHTPITYGRDRSVIAGVSQAGDYLGEIELDQTLSTGVALNNLTPLWYRQTLDPFFAQRPRKPCFYAWRPDSYPAEVAYCWVEGNPRPSNQSPNGMMQISWNFRGIS